MLTACANCGASLDRPPSRLKANALQYCDFNCMGEHRARPVTVHCVICGGPITMKASRATQNATKVCSEECRRQRISEAQVVHWDSAEHRTGACAYCGKPVARKPSQLTKYSSTFCSQDCHWLSLKTSSKVRHGRGFSVRLKDRIRSRDGNRCQRCGAAASGKRKLDVHHRDWSKDNHALDNLVTLCRACHIIVHPRRVKTAKTTN